MEEIKNSILVSDEDLSYVVGGSNESSLSGELLKAVVRTVGGAVVGLCVGAGAVLSIYAIIRAHN